MPRCMSALPASVRTIRYFARRVTSSMRCPGKWRRSAAGIGQRRRGWRMARAVTRRPTRNGARPRRVVSTSGSSGMWRFRHAWAGGLGAIVASCSARGNSVAGVVGGDRGGRRRPSRVQFPFLSRTPPMLDFLLNFLIHGVTHATWLVKLVYFFVVTQLTILAVTLYLHRSQAHRGVDFHPALAHFFRFWSWLTTGMVTKEWVAVHRKHHAHTETADDPHSPQVYGIRKVFFEGVELYREATAKQDDLEKYGRGTPDDWIERHLYSKHSTWGPTLLAIVCVMLFGVGGMAIWAVLALWIPIWAAGVVN